MGLDDLTTDEIIKAIKEKNAHYSKGGYLFFENLKQSLFY